MGAVTPTAFTADVDLCEVFVDYIARVVQKGGNEKTVHGVTRAMVVFQSWLDRQPDIGDCLAVTYDDLVSFDADMRGLYAGSERAIVSNDTTRAPVDRVGCAKDGELGRFDFGRRQDPRHAGRFWPRGRSGRCSRAAAASR
jgi:hypothetical protein